MPKKLSPSVIPPIKQKQIPKGLLIPNDIRPADKFNKPKLNLDKNKQKQNG